MHKKRVRDSFYYYTTVRKGEKTDSVYLGRNFLEARKKEIFLKNIKLNLIILLFLLSIGIVFADTIPINVRPLSGGSIQANTAFDYRFDFTSNQACTNVLHSVTKTITTDKYGIGFAEIDISPLNDTPSYLCEYRALTGGALALRKVHNISTGLFNRSFGKNVKYDYVNITGNLTLGQKTTFALGSYLQEIANWFVSSTSLAVQGDLNVTGNVNVSGYVNASTVYSGGTNLSTLGTYAYNQTEYALTVISTNVSALNASLLAYINANITNLNASINYNYNESNYVLTITNANFTALNESVTKWLYNMSDGSYNITYDALNLTYGQFWYNHTSAVGAAYSTGDTNLQSNISAVNTSLIVYINNNITNLNTSLIYNYNMSSAYDYYNQTVASNLYTDTASQMCQANITDLNNTYGLYWYNMTGSGGMQYQVDNFNVTQNLNATNIIASFINLVYSIFSPIGNFTEVNATNITTKTITISGLYGCHYLASYAPVRYVDTWNKYVDTVAYWDSTMLYSVTVSNDDTDVSSIVTGINGFNIYLCSTSTGPPYVTLYVENTTEISCSNFCVGTAMGDTCDYSENNVWISNGYCSNYTWQVSSKLTIVPPGTAQCPNNGNCVNPPYLNTTARNATAYACLDANGNLYRSKIACVI